jgi:serine/threonine-protein kinase SRK2
MHLDPLREGQRYVKKSDISSGSFGFVQLAQSTRTNELVAIKFLERGDRVNRYVEAEILNHRSLRHPHVIEFKEVFTTKDYICIAMEYACGGSLFHYVQRAGRLKEAAARWFFQQLIIALDFCHKKGVVNRDIKLENTLLQSVPGLPLPLLKICDFGYSKADFMSAPKSRVGTLAYMAPEIIKSAGSYDGKKADIWSCGVMMFVMLFGQYPFEPSERNISHGLRVRTILERINTMQWVMPAGVVVSEDAHDLLRKMLIPDADRRISIEEIQVHPWFTTHLPPNALNMNTSFMTSPEPESYQSVAEIKSILDVAQRPADSKFYDRDATGFDAYEEMIDETIEDELVVDRPPVV